MKTPKIKELFRMELFDVKKYEPFKNKSFDEIAETMIEMAKREITMNYNDFFEFKRFFKVKDWEEIQLSKTSDGSWDALKNSNEYKLVNNKL